MIKKVIVTNYLGESIELNLSRPEDSGFIVRSISGLGPGKSTINLVEVSTNDGALYNSARMSSRNIVMSLLFMDDVETNRQKTYKYFPIMKNVRLLIETDNRLAYIDGRVESNDPNIFSKQEGCDISIICPYPFFYSAGIGGNQQTVFNGINAKFQFPFSNESLTEKLIEFGEINNQTEHVITYLGDYEVGIKITMHFRGSVGDITIYNTRTRETMSISVSKIQSITGNAILSEDEIVINTVKGEKGIKLIRGGDEINILNALSKNSNWFSLSKGDNLFAYTAVSGIENIDFKIENRVIFEGM